MQLPNEYVNQAQTRLYWERNASVTCVVLAVAVGLSAFVRPIGWQLLLGAGTGGILLYLGIALSDRGRGLLGTLLAIGGLVVAVYVMVIAGVIRGPLMWVQGIGTLSAAVLGCMVFAKAVREPEGEQ